MKKIICLFIISLTVFATPGFSQDVDWNRLNSLEPDEVLLSGERKPTKVLLLGTFHFDYPNLDAHKTDSANFVDVLSAQRQKEIQQLTDVIKRFRPTRVYIESTKQSFHDSLYQEYVKGRFKPGRNEIYQLGYRVAAQMNLPGVYAVDASSFANEKHRKGNWMDSLWKGAVAFDEERDQYWNNLYNKMYNAGDSAERRLPLLESFLLMAKPSSLKRMHGAYLSAGFSTVDNSGPDLLSMWWFSRNLRIFNNVLKTKPGGEDRIMILFGSGHMSILKQCFESSPEFELVELESLLE